MPPGDRTTEGGFPDRQWLARRKRAKIAQQMIHSHEIAQFQILHNDRSTDVTFCHSLGNQYQL